MEPNNAQARLGLAQIASANHHPAELRAHLQAAIEADAKDTASKLRLAWLLATSADKDVNDPAQATKIALELNKQANGQHPIILDTLAASHAAANDFAAAIAAAKKAIGILDAAKRDKISREVQGRLKLYEQRKKYVQSR